MPGWFQRKNTLKGVELDKDKKTIYGTTNTQQLNKVPEGFLQFGNTLLKKALHERTNQLESQPIIKKGKNTEIDKILFNSDFPTLRKKAYALSFLEGSCYMLPVHYKDSYILDIWRVIRVVDRIGIYIKEIELMTSTNIIYNDVELPLNATIKHNNGQSIIQFWYEWETEDKELQRIAYDLPKPYKPTEYMIGGILRANYESIPELFYAGLDSTIPFLNYLSQEIIEESYRSRTWWETNSNFTDYEAGEFHKEMKSGKANLQADSFNQKLQSGQIPLISGSQAQTFTQLNYSYIEDKIKEYLGIQRDSVSTGSNKHSLEITLFNQYATETLWAIKDVREHDYRIIFKNLAELTGTELTDEDIVLDLSPIEKAKIDLLNESLEQKKNNGSRKAQKEVNKDA